MSLHQATYYDTETKQMSFCSKTNQMHQFLKLFILI
jgi:hypothetical protein